MQFIFIFSAEGIPITAKELKSHEGVKCKVACSQLAKCNFHIDSIFSAFSKANESLGGGGGTNSKLNSVCKNVIFYSTV